MYYTVYKVTNLLNGKTYIGKHQTKRLDDPYLGSGLAIQRAVMKYHRGNFVKIILAVYDHEWQMNLAERILVVVDKETSYNLGPGGEGGPHFKGKKHSATTRNRLRETSSQRVITEETKRKISIANKKRAKGSYFSLEAIEKMQQKKLGKKRSFEARRAISEGMRLSRGQALVG